MKKAKPPDKKLADISLEKEWEGCAVCKLGPGCTWCPQNPNAKK